MRSLTGQWLGGLSLLVVLTLVVGSGVELRALANSGTLLERIAATAVTPQIVAVARRQLERPIDIGQGQIDAVFTSSGRAKIGSGREGFTPVSLQNVLHLDTPPPARA